MPRLFIGIPVPQSLKLALTKECKEARSSLRSKVKWTARDNWHVTLKFLGSVAEEELPNIQNELGDIHHPPFTMRPGSPICFPNWNKPRVIGLGFMEGAEEAAALAHLVDNAMHDLAFKKEARTFKAHLTMGRIKHLAQDDWRKIMTDKSPQWPQFQVTHFTLWESNLTQTGPTYHTIKEFPLIA